MVGDVVVGLVVEIFVGDDVFDLFEIGVGVGFGVGKYVG